MKRLLLILILATGASAGTFTTYEAIEYASPNPISYITPDDPPFLIGTQQPKKRRSVR